MATGAGTVLSAAWSLQDLGWCPHQLSSMLAGGLGPGASGLSRLGQALAGGAELCTFLLAASPKPGSGRPLLFIQTPAYLLQIGKCFGRGRLLGMEKGVADAVCPFPKLLEDLVF